MKLKPVLFILLLTLVVPVKLWAAVPADQVTKIYVATFNRAPDAGGLYFWTNTSGLTIEGITAEFFKAPETQRKYPEGTTDAEFVNTIYQNVFGRDAEPEGLDYWVNVLGNGWSTRDQMIMTVIDGARNKDLQVLLNKTEVGLYYVSEVGENHVDGNPFSLADITDNEATVADAKQFIDNLTSDDNNNDKPIIIVGESEDIATQDITPTGDMIVINQPGNPLHGMEITVPPGSFPDARSFQISSAPVVQHTLGDLFDPLTPLITVENGGDHSEEFMAVTIPVHIPVGYFAAPFFFDAEKGTLEPMQLVSAEDNHITVITRHFSSFLVTGMAQSMLDVYLAEGIRSDFYPGVDDFSFTNRGSYIAPDGHCAGQAIGAMWYYSAKPEGDRPLWGSYDNNFSDWFTPDFWKDDSYAYRFCSVLQKDMDWGSFAIKFWREAQGRVWKKVNNQWKLVDVPAIGPESTRNLFALSILLTGEPQVVFIQSSSGGGHAMIVYSVTRDALYIADPNYPGDINRTIYYSNGAFDPYPSGDNWDEINTGRGKLYETIHYLAKSTLMPWDNIADRWQEVKNGTIGNDLFPGYEIKYLNEDTGEYELLGENQVFTEEKIKLSPSSLSGGSWGWLVYRNQARLSRDSDNKYALIPGNNLLGFDIAAKVGDDWKYVDFQYVNVIHEPDEKISVPDVVGMTLSDAEQAIGQAGLAVAGASDYDEKAELGRVISQGPAPGTRVDIGSPVRIVISSGPDPGQGSLIAGSFAPHGDGFFTDLVINYNVTGLTASGVEDTVNQAYGTQRRYTLQGFTANTSQLRVSGTASGSNLGGSSQYAGRVTVRVWAGDQSEEQVFPIAVNTSPPYTFDVAVPIPENAGNGGFSIEAGMGWPNGFFSIRVLSGGWQR